MTQYTSLKKETLQALLEDAKQVEVVSSTLWRFYYPNDHVLEFSASTAYDFDFKIIDLWEANWDDECDHENEYTITGICHEDELILCGKFCQVL